MHDEHKVTKMGSIIIVSIYKIYKYILVETYDTHRRGVYIIYVRVYVKTLRTFKVV